MAWAISNHFFGWLSSQSERALILTSNTLYWKSFSSYELWHMNLILESHILLCPSLSPLLHLPSPISPHHLFLSCIKLSQDTVLSVLKCLVHSVSSFFCHISRLPVCQPAHWRIPSLVTHSASLRGRGSEDFSLLHNWNNRIRCTFAFCLHPPCSILMHASIEF